MAIIGQAIKPESPNRFGRQIEVGTAAELTTALAALQANDVIYLKPGNYTGAFTIPYSATATAIFAESITSVARFRPSTSEWRQP